MTSSIASTMPGSFQAVHNASKSVQSFAEALQDEPEDTGITLTSLMLGPTETEFFAGADMKVVASSLSTKVQGVVNPVLPDKVKAAAHRLVAEPKE